MHVCQHPLSFLALLFLLFLLFLGCENASNMSAAASKHLSPPRWSGLIVEDDGVDNASLHEDATASGPPGCFPSFAGVKPKPQWGFGRLFPAAARSSTVRLRLLCQSF